MTKREQAPPGGRCKARNARGEPCRATIVGPDGLCPAHDGRDMRELGRRGGKSRRKGVAEQLPEAERESLREQLRRGLDPELVVRTANEILAGENQTARGNMIRFLADLELYKANDGDGCPRCAKLTEASSKAAQQHVWQMISRYVELAVRDEFAGVDERRSGGDSEALRVVRDGVRRGVEGYEAAIEAAMGRVLDAVANGLVVDHVVSPDRAARVFEMLEEVGLVAGRERIEQRVEELAQERLRVLKQEHGIRV